MAARRVHRLPMRPLLMLLAALQWSMSPIAACADDRADFQAALAHASAQYHTALATIATRGRDESAAEVRHFREAWQIVVDRFSASGATLAYGEGAAGLLTQIDMRIVSALLVIGLGSRDAAQDALAPIQDMLSQLRGQTPAAR